MSLSVFIDLPGVTRARASELDRSADLAGIPLSFSLPRREGDRVSVEMVHLRDDPSIASETLDHSQGWPQDPSVRRWLQRAMEFLAANAPEHRFRFHAGWTEHEPTSEVELGFDEFLERIASGRLRAQDLYVVQVGKHPR